MAGCNEINTCLTPDYINIMFNNTFQSAKGVEKVVLYHENPKNQLHLFKVFAVLLV